MQKDPILAFEGVVGIILAFFGIRGLMKAAPTPKAPSSLPELPGLELSNDQAADFTGRDELAIGPYGELEGSPLGQANHLNQDAAFKSVIPSSEGAAVTLRGNAFTDPDSPHYRFHFSLEQWWNQFRGNGSRVGTRPTIFEYNQALFRALRAAGLSDNLCQALVDYAKENQSDFLLTPSDYVPNVPAPIGQVK